MTGGTTPAPAAVGQVRWRSWRLISLLAALALVCVPSPAAARLVSVDPTQPRVSVADGAVLPAPPAEVTLTFDDGGVPQGLDITLDHDSSHGILLPRPVHEGAVVHQALPTPLVRGGYVLAWSWRTKNGTTVRGQSGFTLDRGIPWPSTGPAPVPTVSTRPIPVRPTPVSTLTPVVATTTPDLAPSSTPVASAEPAASTASTIGRAVGLGALVLAVGAGVLALRQRRRADRGPGGR